jgi:predicted TIM-barrel fold metal-dependent hydrolase
VAASFCENIYLETSTLMPHHVLEVLAHVPANRIMAGSDLPESLHTEIYKIAELNVDEGTRRALLAETAYQVFGNPEDRAMKAAMGAAEHTNGKESR